MIQIFVLVLIFTCLMTIKCLQIDIQPGDYRCIGQNLDDEDNEDGKAIVLIGASYSNNIKKSQSKQKLIVDITDPNDEGILSERVIIGDRTKEYPFDITERGTYLICFNLLGGSSPVRVKFHVDFKDTIESGLNNKNQEIKDDLPSLELQLKAAEESLEDISKEIDFARGQELLLREARDSTATRIHRFGYLSISILIFTSVWQILYLRRFFTSKKLL